MLWAVALLLLAPCLLQAAPVAADVGSPPRITAVAAGFDNTCVLTNAGAVRCWSFNNAHGHAGNGTTIGSLTAVDVSGLGARVTGITAGSLDVCALARGGELKCWGDNHAGQLGNGTTIDSNIPIVVPGLGRRVRAMAMGTDHADDAPAQAPPPGPTITAIAAGQGHTCALTGTGGVLCWGYTESQIGRAHV